MDAVAERAGCNKAMIYHYFANKDALFAAVLEQTYADIRAAEAALEVWPERPDVVEVIGRYIEWGSHVAVENSRPGHVPETGAGVPGWGWGD